MPQRSWLAYAGLALLWGVTFSMFREVIGAVGWAAAVSATSVVISVAIAVFAVLRGRQLDWRLGWARVLLLGAAVAVQNVGIAVAIDRAGTALTAVVLAAVPLFATLIGQIWGLERITLAAVIGLVTGFLGLLLVVAFPATGTSWGFIGGILAGLSAAIAAAFCLGYVRASRKLTGRVEAASGAYFVAAVLTVPLALVFPGAGGGGWAWLWIPVLGLLVGAVGYAVDFLVAHRAEAHNIARARSAGMLVAMLIGAVLMGDLLSLGQWLGALLVLTGGGLVLGLFPGTPAAERA